MRAGAFSRDLDAQASLAKTALRWLRVASGGAGLAAAAVWLGTAPAQAQLLQADDFISLTDNPLMQAPIEQGTQSLIGSPQTVEREPAEQGLHSVKATRELCDTVVGNLAGMQVAQAFEALAPYWPLPNQEIMRLGSETEGQMQQLTGNFGQLLGFEWVRSRAGGSTLVQHLYLVKLETHGLRVACTFYKPFDQWQVHTVFWDDQIDTLLEP